MSHPFSYEIIYSRRKSIAIQITPEGEVRVRAPQNCPKSAITAFVHEKEGWITEHLQKAAQYRAANAQKPKLSPQKRTYYMELARDIFTQKTAYYARIMGVTYNRISIREQKTRWGSCSSSGNLNYNWRLILAPEEIIDYIVVHELAHRKEMNHSRAFYAIVASVLPDYKVRQRWLKEHGNSLWTRL